MSDQDDLLFLSLNPNFGSKAGGKTGNKALCRFLIDRQEERRPLSKLPNKFELIIEKKFKKDYFSNFVRHQRNPVLERQLERSVCLFSKAFASFFETSGDRLSDCSGSSCQKLSAKFAVQIAILEATNVHEISENDRSGEERVQLYDPLGDNGDDYSA